MNKLKLNKEVLSVLRPESTIHLQGAGRSVCPDNGWTTQPIPFESCACATAAGGHACRM